MEVLTKELHNISFSCVSVDTTRTSKIIIPQKIPDPRESIRNHLDSLVDTVVNLERALDEDELNSKLMPLIDFWWGRLMTGFGSNIDKYSSMIKNHFSLSDPLLERIFKTTLPRFSAIERCPRIQIQIHSFNVHKFLKITSKYYLLLRLSSDPDYFSRVNESDAGKTSAVFYLDEKNHLSLQVELWKDGKFDTSIKGTGSFPLILDEQSEIKKVDSPLFSDDGKEVALISFSYSTKNVFSDELARIKIPDLFRTYFQEVLDPDIVFVRNKNSELPELPEYILGLKEARVGESAYDLVTSVFLNEIEHKPDKKGTLKLRILNPASDIITLVIKSADKEMYSLVKNLYDLLPLTENGVSEIYHHINKTKFIWNWNFGLCSSMAIPENSADILNNFFYKHFKSNLEETVEENSTVPLDPESWTPILPIKYKNLVQALNILDPSKNSWSRSKGEALLQLHSKYRFDDEILHPYFKIPEICSSKWMSDYVAYALHHLAFFVTVGTYDKLPSKRLKSALNNLLILYKDEHLLEEHLRPEMIKMIYTKHPVGSLEGQKRTLDQSILPSIRGTPSIFKDFGFKWIKLLGEIYLDISLPLIQEKMKTMILNKENGTLTYNLYVKLRSIEDRPDLLVLFRDCLDSWVDSTLSQADLQVSKVLEMEESQKTKDDFEILHEEAMNIDGIFDTCRFVWEEIRWPVPEENIRFGAKLLQGLHSIYCRYIQQFTNSLSKDSKSSMSPDRLITILNSHRRSIGYLTKFHDSVNFLIDKFGQNDHDSVKIHTQIGQFAEVLASAKEEVESREEEIIEKFVKDQEMIICYYMSEMGQIHDELNGSSEPSSSLDYVNAVLRTIDGGIDTGDQNSDKRLKSLIQESLLSFHETLVIKYYETLKTQYTSRRGGRDPKIFDEIIESLPHMIGFRRTLSLPDNPNILNLQNQLYPVSYGSPLLVSKHLEKLSSKYKAHHSVGQLRLEINCEKSNDDLLISVDLKSAVNIVPRPGKSGTNLSVSISIWPHYGNEIYDVRSGIYSEITEIFFDLRNDDEDGISSEHVFHLQISDAEDVSRFIVMEIFDHYKALPGKLFRGWSIIPLEDANKTNQVQLYPVDSQDDTQELDELSKRKDKLAKDYVNKLKHYSQGKKILTNSMTFRQEWIKR